MATNVLCVDDLPESFDVNCEYDNVSLISGVYMANQGYPLVLPVAVGNETDAARLTREILRRVALASTDPERIRYVKLYKGTMPAPTAATKTNPNTGNVVLSEDDTELRIEGVDYRDNPEVRAFWKALGKATAKLIYPVNGLEIMTGKGFAGIRASCIAVQAIENSTEISHSVRWSFSWKGNPIPDRQPIAA